MIIIISKDHKSWGHSPLTLSTFWIFLSGSPNLKVSSTSLCLISKRLGGQKRIIKLAHGFGPFDKIKPVLILQSFFGIRIRLKKKKITRERMKRGLGEDFVCTAVFGNVRHSSFGSLFFLLLILLSLGARHRWEWGRHSKKNLNPKNRCGQLYQLVFWLCPEF